MKSFVCMPLNQARYLPPGATIQKCGKCGESVSITPATLAQKEPGDEVLCLPCFNREAAQSTKPIQFAPFTPWQLREMRAAFYAEAR